MLIMKNIYTVIFGLIVMLGLMSADAVKLKKTKPVSGITVSMPEDFLPMTDDDIAARFPSNRKPLAAFTAPNAKTEFVINMANNLWGNRLIVLKDIYKASVMNLFQKVTFLQDTIITRGKRNYIVLEFISEQENKMGNMTNEPIKFYTHINYTVADNRIFIFNFTTRYRLLEEWQSTAQAMMNSIKVNSAAVKLIPEVKIIPPKGGVSPKEAIIMQRKQKSVK